MKSFSSFLEEKMINKEQDFWNTVLDTMNKMVKKSKQSVQGVAFDIVRQFDLDVTPRELSSMYSKIYEDTTTASVAGAGDDNTTVPVRKKKKFDVPHHIFKRFKQNPRMKYERWIKHLNPEGLYEDKILEYIKSNRSSSVILRSIETLEEIEIS